MTKRRKTGIDVIGYVPWSTHFCQFYQTKQDLLDILVPYFKAGLENNEFCMWITAAPLAEQEAHQAMMKEIPNFAQYLTMGQIELLPHSLWYLKDGIFDSQKVINGWVDKLNRAIARGYSGMRVAGNTAWLKRNGWQDFTEYEAKIINVIGKHKIMALCTYWLDKCSGSDIIDVVNNHRFALLKKQGRWELIESTVHRRTKEALASRRDKIVKLRKEGLTYAEIGHNFGITRQRVSQILSPKPPKPAREKPDLHSKIILTLGEAASLLDIHTNTLRRWSDKGVIRTYRITQRGDRRFRREDIDAFLKGLVRN